MEMIVHLVIRLKLAPLYNIVVRLVTSYKDNHFEHVKHLVIGAMLHQSVSVSVIPIINWSTLASIDTISRSLLLQSSSLLLLYKKRMKWNN